MAAIALWPFQSPACHEQVSSIIRRHSTNPVDVRDVALTDLDSAAVRSVLDLGCGFGFMAEKAAPLVAADARIIGIDVWAANEGPFLSRVRKADRKGRFYQAEVGTKFPCVSASHDLVVCSYSLYFFVEALPEIVRVLKPEGTFLAVTHSNDTYRNLLRAVGLKETGSELLALTRAFCAENGAAVLGEWFGQVDRIDYPNSLRFSVEDLDELFTYLRFKLPLLVPDASAGEDLPEALVRAVKAAVADGGQLSIEKNDAVFRCTNPRCR